MSIDPKVLNPLYQDLLEEIKAENNEQVVQIAESILQKVPTEPDVLAAKVIALLKLSKLDQAAQYFKTEPNKNSHEVLPYGYAYFLYKKGQYEECLKYIKKQDSNSVYKIGFLALEAQIKYKQGNFTESSDLYVKTLQTLEISQDNTEIVVNLLNSVILDNNKNSEQAIKIADSYIAKFGGDLIREFFFNLSLLYSNNMTLSNAINYLNKFKQIVETEGDLDEPEVQNDLLMYDIQLDYINSFQYEYSPEEAEAKITKYSKVLEQKLDEYYSVLLQNNIACLRQQKDVSDSIRKMDDIITKSQKNQKFSKAQVLAFKINKLLLLLNKNKYTESAKLLEDLEKGYDSVETLTNPKFVSAKFYLLFRTKKYKEIEALYTGLLETLQKSNIKGSNKTLVQTGITLTYAEVERLLGNQKSVLQNLNSLYNLDADLMKNDVLNSLVLSTISKNFNLMSDFKPLVDSILKSTNSTHILSLIAELYIKEKKYAPAIQIYEKILSISGGTNVKALEKLCFLHSFTDWKKAKEYLDKIPQIDMIMDPNELKRLENDYLPSKGSKIPGEEKMEIESKSKKIKKRKRKPRYPKGFDPANPPGPVDKERWLPMLERSKNKKLAQKKGFKGAQGATAGKETMATFKSGPSTANQKVATTEVKTGAKKKRKE
jgi:signal recognition particle subunit SRP72